MVQVRGRLALDPLCLRFNAWLAEAGPLRYKDNNAVNDMPVGPV